MGIELVYLEGEAYVSLSAIAECYECSPNWIAEVYEYGLLGEGRRNDEDVVVAVQMLDRVARIRQLHTHHGLDLQVIAVILL